MAHEPEPARASVWSAASALVLALCVGLVALSASYDRADAGRADLGAALSDGAASIVTAAEALPDDGSDEDHALACAGAVTLPPPLVRTLSRARAPVATHDRRRSRHEPPLPTGPPSTTSERNT